MSWPKPAGPARLRPPLRTGWASLGVGLLAVTLLCACATPGRRAELLQQSLRAYEGALRWGRMETVAAFYREPWPAADALDRLRITGYRVRDQSVDAEQNWLEQRVEVRYYHLDYLREQTVLDAQRWEYDAARQRWLIVSAPPRFPPPQ